MIDLRGNRIDVHVRYGSKCAFTVETGIDLTGAVLHASLVDRDGAIWCPLVVEILSPATKGDVRLSVASPTSLIGTDAPPNSLSESTSLTWGLSKHVTDPDSGSYFHEPLAYGKFAIGGPLGLRADEL